MSEFNATDNVLIPATIRVKGLRTGVHTVRLTNGSEYGVDERDMIPTPAFNPGDEVVGRDGDKILRKNLIYVGPLPDGKHCCLHRGYTIFVDEVRHQQPADTEKALLVGATKTAVASVGKILNATSEIQEALNDLLDHVKKPNK